MSLLALRGLSIRAGDLALVDGVDLDLHPGEIVALVGESGSGKSLTALALMGLVGPGLRVGARALRIAGQEIAPGGPAQAALRGRVLGMIFQEPVAALNPLMAVGAQVAESLIVQGIPRTDAAARAVRMLARVGIPDPERRARQLPAELSGGMCQRVMIAAALIARPRILIADEPTTALDVTIQAQILALIRDLAAEAGTAVLFITHDMGVVAELADRVCVMYGGRIVEEAPVGPLFAAPRHPYTAMLLRTIPRLDDPPRRALFVIPGTVPAPRDWPEGCRFRTRCPRADAACAAPPALCGQEHRTACAHPLPPPNTAEAP